MRLSELLRAIGKPCAQADVEISRVTDALSRVEKNSLFVCVRGQRRDGHSLAAAAENRGAAAVVAERPVQAAHVYCVDNSRLAFSLLSAAFCGQPHRALRMIGITGTNGKTTTAQFLCALLQGAGEPCAVLGTLGFSVGGETTATGYTTPPSDVFFECVRAAKERGCTHFIAEVSSQALAQFRADGARFDLGIFTNLGRDHLDHHGDMASLLAAKARLCALSDAVLLNADDRSAAEFSAAALAAGAGRCFYSCAGAAPAGELPAFFAKEIVPLENGFRFVLAHDGAAYEARIRFPGLFNVYNALASSAAAVLCGVPPEEAARGLADLPQTPGRAQCVRLRGIRVCVDFAHTPDALAAVLRALGTEEKKPIAVFGCGGDRDRGKRPLMGRAAAENASVIVLTSDNPRSEDPLEIISEIAQGIPPGARVFREPDRRRAIGLALELASPGDTVVIAGKGHETCQLAGNEKLPFSDMEEVLNRLRRPEDGERNSI